MAVVLAETKSLLAGDSCKAATILDQIATSPDAEGLLPFIRALLAIVCGSRNRTLADETQLKYSMAAEILFLIETQEKNGSDCA